MKCLYMLLIYYIECTIYGIAMELFKMASKLPPYLAIIVQMLCLNVASLIKNRMLNIHMDITTIKMYFKFTYNIDPYMVNVNVILRSKYEKYPNIWVFLYNCLLLKFFHVVCVCQKVVPELQIACLLFIIIIEGTGFRFFENAMVSYHTSVPKVMAKLLLL